MIGTETQADHMWHDQSDEPDQARHRYRNRRQQRRDNGKEQLNATVRTPLLCAVSSPSRSIFNSGANNRR